MKSLRDLMLVAASLLVGTPALGHQGGEHLMGTVISIDRSTISVSPKGKEKQPVQVMLDGKTAFEKSGSKASVKDLKVGQRVVIHGRRHGGMLHATLVKLGKPPKQGKRESCSPPAGAGGETCRGGG